MSIQIFADSKSELTVTALIPNTSPEFVYQCWTVTEHLEKWWVQKVKQLEIKPEGNYEFHWMVNDSTLRGQFKEIQPHQHLSFTWKWDHLPELAERTVKIDFSTVNEQDTKITIWHGPYGETEPEQQERQNHIDGWQFFMEQLTNYCAGE